MPRREPASTRRPPTMGPTIMPAESAVTRLPDILPQSFCSYMSITMRKGPVMKPPTATPQRAQLMRKSTKELAK